METKYNSKKDMNKQQFYKKLKKIIISKDCNINFMEKWYEFSKKEIMLMSDKNSLVKHARHRGDAREDDYIALIRNMIPKNFNITKGYAVNKLGASSCELDCLFYAKEKTFTLAKTASLEYVPVNSVLAATEIKSNYSLEAIRDSVINCLSYKTMLDLNKENTHLYTVFAYDYPYTLQKLSDELNKISQIITDLKNPNIKRLPIDMVYVLNKGLIYRKTQNNEFELSVKGVMENIGEYGADKECNYSFLMYLGVIIDFIIQENLKRSPSNFMDFAMNNELLKVMAAVKIQANFELPPNSRIRF